MKKSLTWKWRYEIIIFLFSLSLISINYFVLNIDSTPFVYDIRNLRELSLEYYSYFKTGDLNGFFKLYNELYFYPPFFVFSSIPLYFIFGLSQDISSMTNSFFVIILLFSVYYIGKKLKNETAGLLSAFFVGITPGILSFSRVYLTDFALSSAVALSICLLLYADDFRNKKFSFFFGLSLGFGMMMKWAFALFLIGPLMLLIIKFIFAQKKIMETRHFLLGGIIGSLIPITWYYNKLDYIIHRAVKLNFDYSVQIGGFNSVTFGNLTWYIHSLFYPMLAYLFLYFAFFAFYYLFFLKIKKKHYILAWILIPLLVYTFSPWKDSRYLLPFIPAFGIMAGISIISIVKENKIKKIFCGLALLLLLISSSLFFILLDKDEKRNFTPVSLFSEGLMSPNQKDYGLDRLYALTDYQNKTKTVLIIPNSILLDLFMSYKNDMQIDRGLFCIGSGGESNCGELAFKNYANISYICTRDIIISYNESFNESAYGVIFLPNNSEIRSNVINPLISNWEACKSRYVLIGSLKDSTSSNRTIMVYRLMQEAKSN